MLTNKNIVPLALLGLMFATRFHHFGDALSLPDASLAVFFFAGLWVSGWRFFAGLLLAAGLIDYVAISQFSVSDYCVSPAYVFLILTYGCLWAAGKYCANLKETVSVELAITLSVLMVATLLAFVISNGSFYLFSGKFTDLSWLEYASRVEQYFLPYLTSTMIYGVVILAVANILSLFISLDKSKSIA